MIVDLSNADSRALHEPFVEKLSSDGPEAALKWLTAVLATQSSGLRSSNAFLVAYTGRSEAIDWIEETVASPVTTHWGQAAALLGTPWPRIKGWLAFGGERRMVALDTLIAYRAAAPNMAPLAQVAAPVLPDAPTQEEFEQALNDVLSAQPTPRIRKAVESVRAYAGEILTRKVRGVEAHDLPLLYLYPDRYPGFAEIFHQQEAALSGARKAIQDMLKAGPDQSLPDRTRSDEPTDDG